MRKILSPRNVSVLILAISFLLGGCLKDTCRHTFTYTIYEPIYKTTVEVLTHINSNAPTDITNPGKMVLLGNYIFLNEINKGIHVIDNSNPSSPKNIAFIDIPGNVDLALKGNTLYADLYTDLIVLDVSNPLHVVTTKTVTGVFPERQYDQGFTPDGARIITGWAQHDTIVAEDCAHQGLMYPGGIATFQSTSAPGAAAQSAPVGITGSMARFALIGNYLYTVDDNDLNVFNITNGNDPVMLNKLAVDWHVETIYPFKNNLFIGSNNGMFMFDVSVAPDAPTEVGEFTHARSCDPVIADDSFAFVTLHSESSCQSFNNELDVVKLNNLSNSELVKSYNFTSPRGLSKDGNLLFLCDGTDGLKVFNATDVMNLQLIRQFPGAETFDVIAYNKVAIVVATDGLYQYDYSSPDNIKLLSKIAITN
jgi:hypothetical protein